MKILISGSTGFIGSSLVPRLLQEGHTVLRLARPTTSISDSVIRWDPESGFIDQSSLEGLEGVIHLAGENIAGRWTTEKKIRIRESRVKGTRLLCETLAQREQPPKVFISASAIGYYGDRGEELLTEESPPGKGFLAEVAQQWESATEPAQQRGIRVVLLRMGVVLSPQGGALGRMLPLFQKGLGGVLGSGKQYMSWIAMEDLLRVFLHTLNTTELYGPVNAVSPNPVTNAEFTRILGKVLRRPTFFPAPAFGLRLLLGEMAEEMLLASQRVYPKRLLDTGFSFLFPELGEALNHLLGKTPSS